MHRIVHAFALTALAVTATHAQAVLVYEWVPDRGSGGQGQIIFDDAYISANTNGIDILYTDAENFITTFGPQSVLSISFTFDNGFSIDQAAGFSEATTIQNDLNNTPFQVVDGELAGYAGGSFSFEYTTIRAANAYVDTTVDEIFCLVAPCPQRGAHFAFSGQQAAESNIGRFVLVPEPASLTLLALGGASLMMRRRKA
ncbi:MAG: PEP-CTERM sorting domain-containing protein [Planctomycetota bacterium]